MPTTPPYLDPSETDTTTTTTTEPPTGPARLRESLHSRELTRLLRRRPDLAGVHGPADAMAATITWSA